ncbi:hypothetical protein R2F61_06970 [Mollicutes bacterium LVI A0078]|nr:hypothetical protein RZE84_06975 [Mollicutes bacterium LVI A0075]WOO90465.1 hypothetical protein R2F61_06970 [Mollicutes bacterium LVI A0078]
MQLLEDIITAGTILLTVFVSIALGEILYDEIVGADEVEEVYRCDELPNGTIVDGKVFNGIFSTRYQLELCDETSIRDDGESQVTVSPNTYSDYEQGKINKLENWEA